MTTCICSYSFASVDFRSSRVRTSTRWNAPRGRPAAHRAPAPQPPLLTASVSSWPVFGQLRRRRSPRRAFASASVAESSGTRSCSSSGAHGPRRPTPRQPQHLAARGVTSPTPRGSTGRLRSLPHFAPTTSRLPRLTQDLLSSQEGAQDPSLALRSPDVLSAPPTRRHALRIRRRTRSPSALFVQFVRRRKI